MSPFSGHDLPGPTEPRRRGPLAGEVAGRLAGWCANRPGPVLIGGAIVCVLSLLSVGRLHVTSSLAAMLGTHSPTAAAMQRVTTEYQSGEALRLLVELPADRTADDAARAELVEFATRLERALMGDPAVAPQIASMRFRQSPEVRRFAQEVMLPNGTFYLTDESAAELLRRLEPPRMHEQFARNEALVGAPGPAGAAVSRGVLRDPLRLLELIPADLRPGEGTDAADGPAALPEFSQDGRALLIHISAASAGGDYEAAARLVDAVVTRSAALNTSGLRIEPAGSAAIAEHSSRVIRRDAVVSCLVSVGLLYALFLLFYRRWSAGLLIGGVAAVGMLAGVGALAVVFTEVSPLAAMIAALLAGLGTDYGIHFLSHYDGYRAEGLASADASVRAARHMAVPIATNCFTSIFGFIALWPSQIQMLRDFAVMGAAGLIGALVAVFTLMPAALAAFDRTACARPAGRAALATLADTVAAHPRRCMASSLLVLGVAIVAAALQHFSLQVEPDLTVMHPRPSRVLDATAEVVRRFSTHGDLIPIEVRADTPANLVAAAHDTALALRSSACRAAGVTGAMGLHQLLPDPRVATRRAAMLDGIDVARTLASFDAALAASAFEPAAYTEYRDFLRRLVSGRHPPALSDLLDHPSMALRVLPTASVLAGIPPASTVLVATLAEPLHDRTQRRAAVDAMRAAVATVSTGRVTVAGLAAVSAELEDATRDGLPQSIALSCVLVVLWLLLVFRRPLDVLLALLPLLFAAGTTVLFIIATKQKFNPINSVAIPLLDGIAVDAGVFLVSAYRAHGAARGALRVHLRSTTHAVLLSMSTTATAFAALCFTHTPAIQSLGLVSAAGIVASGVGALLLLMPVLLRRAPELKAG